MTRLLLLGKIGQLGWELNRALLPLGNVVVLDYPEIDFVKVTELRNRVLEARPDIILNAVAYTAVDRAESETAVCRLVNGVAPGVLAETALSLGASLIHYSTDYVFDGKKGQPYCEKDLISPLSVYGETKLEGEQNIRQVGGSYLIFRTSWVYSMRKGGFVTKVLQWAHEQETLRMVADQISNPTWARLLAEVTAQVLAKGGASPSQWLRERAGLYHLASSDYTSRYEWAQAIIENDPDKDQQKVKWLIKALTSDFPTPAVRPLFSALNCELFESTFGLRLPCWRETLPLAMDIN